MLNGSVGFEEQVVDADREQAKTDQEWAFCREVFPRIPYPWYVLPGKIATSLQQLARSHATSPVALPGAACAIICSTVGATLSVSPKQSWDEPLVLWFTDCRDTGLGKTHAVRALDRVIVKAQIAANAAFAEQEESEESKPINDRKKVPRAKAFFTTDLTLEGIRNDCAAREHGGIVCFLDELSAFISAQNQYKSKGADREAWLCLYDGKAARASRAERAVTIANARVSIVGGCQPRVWLESFGARSGLYLSDGTVYRFLTTFEPYSYHELTAEPWSDENRSAWDDTLSMCMSWADEIVKIPQWKARRLQLTDDARRHFLKWRNTLARNSDKFPQPMRGYLPKFYGQALRLAGALYCIDVFSKGDKPDNFLDLNAIKKGIAALSFYAGHAVDAMMSLSTGSVAYSSVLEEQAARLAVTLEKLRGDIDSGRLAVGFIQERFNAENPEQYRFKTPKSMGSFLRGVGLSASDGSHDANGRRAVRCLIWDKKTEAFIKQRLRSLQSLQTQADSGFTDADIGKETSAKSEKSTDEAGVIQTLQTLGNECPQAETLSDRGLTDNADNADVVLEQTCQTCQAAEMDQGELLCYAATLFDKEYRRAVPVPPYPCGRWRQKSASR